MPDEFDEVVDGTTDEVITEEAVTDDADLETTEPEGAPTTDSGPGEGSDAGPDAADEAEPSEEGDAGDTGAAAAGYGTPGDGVLNNRDEHGFQNQNVWTI